MAVQSLAEEVVGSAMQFSESSSWVRYKIVKAASSACQGPVAAYCTSHVTEHFRYSVNLLATDCETMVLAHLSHLHWHRRPTARVRVGWMLVETVGPYKERLLRCMLRWTTMSRDGPLVVQACR